MRASVKRWLRGWVGAAVAGAASAVSTGLSGIALAPDHFNLGEGIVETMKLVALGAVVQAVLGASLELKKAPLPEDDEP